MDQEGGISEGRKVVSRYEDREGVLAPCIAKRAMRSGYSD